MTAEHAFDTPNYAATSTALAGQQFAQPAPVTLAEAATAQTIDDPPAAIDLDRLADPAPLAWYTAIAALDEQIAALQEQRDRAAQIIQDAMGDAQEARVAGRPVITWKTSRPTMRLDRKALEAAYGEDVIAGFLRESKAARPFRVVAKGSTR